MNQNIRERPERWSDPLGAQSGNVMLDDEDRVYVAPGDVVAGKYRVERVLGVGGMGFVVAATHVQLEGTFALKFLKKRFLTDAVVVDRFAREAKAACRIQSDYVARVFDVGTTNGAPFLVMDCLVGRDLAAILAERGRLSIEDAVEYVVQACAALAAAHACGVVHRDIKPENLFLVETDGVSSVKLLDFGISSVALSGLNTKAPSRLTGALTLGTPFYMSPEQIRSTASADAQSDLWSLGVVLYELLTGSCPFFADSVSGVCAAILENEPPSILQFRPDVPVGLPEIVERCLRKAPDERYRNVSDLAVALLGFAPARSLAVAERSSSIRRAALQALGSVPDAPARTSSTTIASLAQVPWAIPGRVSSVSARLVPPPPVEAPPTSEVSAPSRGKYGRAGTALVACIAGVAAIAMLVARRSPAPARFDAASEGPSTQVAPSVRPAVAPAFAKESFAPPRADDRLTPAASDEARPPRGSPGPALHAAPVPAHWNAPPRAQPVATAVRGPVRASAAASSPEVAAPPATVGPPLTPGRPDLGY